MEHAILTLAGLDEVYIVGASLLLISLLLVSAKIVYNLFFHPLASYPGPFANRASELPRLVQQWRGTTVHRWAALHDRYGPVVRIAPNELSYISAAAWQDIYGARTTAGHTSSAKSNLSAAAVNTVVSEMPREEFVFPGDDFDFFAPAKPMISCDAANHARQRRAVGPAFSDRSLRTYEPLLVRYTDLFLDRLQRQFSQSQDGNIKGVNIVDWFHFLMFDITSALVFGRPFGNLENAAFHPWVARVFPGMKLIAWSAVVAAVPGLGRLIAWCLPRKVVNEARIHMQSIIDMTDARCKRELKVAESVDPYSRCHHHGNLSKQPDFMHHILPSSPHGDLGKGTTALSTGELYLNAQLLCIAGSETTASLLSAAVYFLCQHDNAHHRSRLLSELREHFTSECEISPSSLVRLPFLAAIMNECLRLYPPGAINMPRVVPPGGAMVDGKYVPEGSVVGIAQYAAYRSATHWTDPLKFAPERWLSPECEGVRQYVHDNRSVFKPFSFGPRNCVGQNLALAECKLVAARLFWRFGENLYIIPGQEGWIDGQRTFLGWEKPSLRVCLSTLASA